jgi:hypothetical protein
MGGNPALVFPESDKVRRENLHMASGGNLVKILERLGQGGVCLDVDPILLIKTRHNRGLSPLVRHFELESDVAKRLPIVGRAREKNIRIPNPTGRLCRLALKRHHQSVESPSHRDSQIQVLPNLLKRKR